MCSWYLPKPINRNSIIQIYGKFWAIDLDINEFIPREGFTMSVGVVKIINGEYIPVDGEICYAKTNLDGVANCSFIAKNFPNDTNNFVLHINIGGILVGYPININ